MARSKCLSGNSGIICIQSSRRSSSSPNKTLEHNGGSPCRSLAGFVRVASILFAAVAQLVVRPLGYALVKLENKIHI